MKKEIVLLALAGVFAAGTAYGSAFRIPEQSINSTALSGAYIANANGPDASYFNPANMSWAEDRWQLEADLTYINLSHINYEDNRTSFLDGSSGTENFFLPQLHVVSKDYNNFRFGFSLTYPFGLTKKWNDLFTSASAKNFTLEVIEANPTISYKVSDIFSIAAGVRIIKSEGKVKSLAIATPGLIDLGGLTSLGRDMNGEAEEIGYNFAMTLKPMKKWTIATTYRSRVDLNMDGDATLSAMHPLAGLIQYDDDAELRVVTPAVFSLGTSYTYENTTVELEWDRTFWSKYYHLNFEYKQSFAPGTPFFNFDTPLIRDWDNADAYRIGITHKCTDKLTTMIGFAIDKTPVPTKTLGFELPDSDAKIYSIGFRYQKTDQLEIGAAYLYDDKESRKVTNNDNGIDGEFEDAAAHLLTLGFTYKY
jgi:long-chain fatty acid transport protein